MLVDHFVTEVDLIPLQIRECLVVTGDPIGADQEQHVGPARRPWILFRLALLFLFALQTAGPALDLAAQVGHAELQPREH